MNVKFVALALSLVAIPGITKQHRSSFERHAFVKDQACPATGENRLPCPGYQIDHIKPLCAGGADHKDNMQWITIADHKTKTRLDVATCRALNPPP